MTFYEYEEPMRSPTELDLDLKVVRVRVDLISRHLPLHQDVSLQLWPSGVKSCGKGYWPRPLAIDPVSSSSELYLFRLCATSVSDLLLNIVFDVQKADLL